MELKQTGILCFLMLQLSTLAVLAQDAGKLNELLNEKDIQKQVSIVLSVDDEKESVRLTDEAISRFPDNAVYYYLRGVVNNGREKFSRALDDFSKAIDLNPPADQLYRFYLGRGLSYMGLLEFDQALEDLNSSITHNDTVAGAYYSRGMVNYELHDYEAAVGDFQKILEFSEGNAELYFNMGMAYFRMNERDNACINLNKACTMGSTNACRMSLMECAKAIPAVP